MINLCVSCYLMNINMIYLKKSTHIAKNGHQVALHHTNQAQKTADSGTLSTARGIKIQLTPSKELFLFTIQHHVSDKAKIFGGHGSNDRSTAYDMNDRIIKISDENIAIRSITGDLYTFQNSLANLNASVMMEC